MLDDNIIFKTDSYKLTHGAMYPEGTTGVYSYLEARDGARDPETLFFGLQPILHDLEDFRVTAKDVCEAQAFTDRHIGPGIFNYDGWMRVVEEHHGRLPLRIKAVPEGTVVPVGNVLMTVENTDSKLPWLTNALESLLLHVWYPITVGTTSYQTKKMLVAKLKAAGHSNGEIAAAIPFMLHDFGYRGASSDQSAAIGGAAHLVSFVGTDTLPAIRLAQRYYGADMPGLSVPATEHSVMTSLGKVGEQGLVADLLRKYPTGILSLVGDSYDIFRFTAMLGSTFKDQVLARDGKVVVRPDSGDPISQVPEILSILWDQFGGTTTTTKGFKVLDPHVGVLWGDGLDGKDEIERIIDAVMAAGFSPINLVFGMGGGLLQKVNRDTERFAFKCSAQMRNGVWIPIQKDPLDQSKKSKAGRLKLVHTGTIQAKWSTVTDTSLPDTPDRLESVFENGAVTRFQSFDDIRARAAIRT